GACAARIASVERGPLHEARRTRTRPHAPSLDFGGTSATVREIIGSTCLPQGPGARPYAATEPSRFTHGPGPRGGPASLSPSGWSIPASSSCGLAWGAASDPASGWEKQLWHLLSTRHCMSSMAQLPALLGSP